MCIIRAPMPLGARSATTRRGFGAARGVERFGAARGAERFARARVVAARAGRRARAARLGPALRVRARGDLRVATTDSIRFGGECRG